MTAPVPAHPRRTRALSLRAGRAVISAWLLVLTSLLEWPITRHGYLLAHDMVFTPHQPLDAASLGISSAAPRAVPLDALVAIVEHVVDGAVVGRIAVLVPALAAGFGCAALLADCSFAARIASATAALWNPFVVERLAIGQWALLWSYAALPWLVLALRAGPSRRVWALRAVALAAAAITPTGALLAGGVALAVTFAQRPDRRQVLSTALLVLVVQLPWLLPALTSASAGTSDPRAVALFGPRAENSGGTVLSLLGGGGIWDADVVPASRAGLRAFVWLALLAVAVLVGSGQMRRRTGSRVAAGLAVTAAVGLLLAALPALPGGGALLRATVDSVPGAGVLRDSQKWVAPLVVLEALVIGAAVDRAVVVARDRAQAVWAGVIVLAAAALPLLVLPDAPTTLRTPLHPVSYPADWAAVGRVLAHRSGDVAVLPFSAYRSFAWAPGRTVLDPAPRLLPLPTVVDDHLVVGGTVLRGENPRVRRVAGALRSGPRLADRLAAAGISWVVVEHGTPGDVPRLTGLVAVRAGRDVSLYRVPGHIAADHRSTAVTVVVLTGDALAALLVIASAVAALPIARRRRGRRRPTVA